MLKGVSYRGRAFVVTEWHEAVYEPLFDASGKNVVGMLYVGTSVADSEAYLRDAMMQIAVGKTGRMFVLGTSGKERGSYLLSREESGMVKMPGQQPMRMDDSSSRK